ncbi:HepT-like ribonuclease domain-containing protein [Roseateles chitinivorans]|uniref:HepT-like ribonuclease domain-containing protein n=1 Tax=Roseateles chitinivorans TaxID=2917965 RepID=UPI003D665979
MWMDSARPNFWQTRKRNTLCSSTFWCWEEAAARLLAEHEAFLAAHAHVPWRLMRGIRNRIAHRAVDINIDVIWDTVDVRLVDLLRQLPAVRASAFNQG